MYVLLSTAQNLLNMVGGVSSIELTVHDPYSAEDIAQSIANSTGLNALSWITTNSQFFLAMRAQTYSSLLIRVFVALSVAGDRQCAGGVGCAAAKRHRHPAGDGRQPRAGAADIPDTRCAGWFSGICDRLMMAVGLLAMWKIVARNPDGTPMFVINVDWQFFVWSALLAMLAGVLAAATPAVRAARLDPVVAIRG
jgi:lipoprotein-releasing system permease protein